MLDFELTDKKLYDYKPEYLKNLTQQIKQTFIKRCLADDTLSKEYKTFVSNPENIKVGLTPCYGYDILADLSYVDVEYEYDYTSSYQSGSYLSGTGTLDSNGNVKLDSLKSTPTYSSYSSSYKGSSSFWTTSMQDCKMHLGNATFVKSNSFMEVNGKNIPDALKALGRKELSYETLKPLMTPSKLPKEVYAILKAKAVEFTSSYYNFRMTRILDYRLDKCYLFCFPTHCQFSISVTFQHMTYRLENLTDVEKITSKGPQSNHYKQFTDEAYRASKIFNPARWGSRKIALIPVILSFLVCLGLIFVLCFSKQLGCVSLRMNYLWLMIFFIVIAGALGGISIKGLFPVTLDGTKSLYDSSKSIPQLKSAIYYQHHSKQKRLLRLTCLWLAGVVVVSAILGASTGFLLKKTYNRNFFYTPEIIREYSKQDKKEKTEEIWTIVSCDLEGNIVAVMEAISGKNYAKIQYNGTVVDKNGRGDTTVEFAMDKWLYNPKVGTPDETPTVLFYEDYTKMKMEDDGSIFDSELTILDRSLSSPAMITTFVCNDDFLEVLSCDEQGNIQATYGREIGNVIKARLSFSGKILYKKVSGETLVSFTAGEWDETLSTITVNKNPLALFTSNYTKVQFQSTRVSWTGAVYDTFSVVNA